MVPARANTTPAPQPAARLHPRSCLLPTCVRRGGNGPWQNSQQHPAPCPLGKPVSDCQRSQWPHSGTAKGIFTLCQTGRYRTCKKTRHIQPALVAPHLLWFRDEKRNIYTDPSQVRFMKARAELTKGEGIDTPQIILGNTNLLPLQRQQSCVPHPGSQTGKGRAGSQGLMRGDLKPWEMHGFACIS